MPSLNLTPEQEAFIERVGTTQDSIRLDAVAGSGKTTTLVLASKHIAPTRKAVALAFNKNIAEELSNKFPDHISCKTLNSIGHGVWAKYQGRKTLSTKKTGGIVSEWVNAAKDAKKITEDEAGMLWNAIRQIVQACKAAGVVPQIKQSLCTYQPREILTTELVEDMCERFEIPYDIIIYRAVESVLNTSIGYAYTKQIDFDDQVYMSTYFAPNEAWPTFDVILVDEAQDLSPLQHDMLDRLSAKNARLIVVGDVNQAIYGWRGASCHSLQELQDRYNLVPMPLTVSFRCPEKIVKLAQDIVPHIKANKPDGTITYWKNDENDSSKLGWFIEDFIPGSVVLCRNNAPLISLGFAFIKHGIPTFFTGRDLSPGLKKIVQALPDNLPPLTALHTWYTEEKDRLISKGKYDLIDKLRDKYECLTAVYRGANATDKESLIAGIDRLFLREYSPDAIELSTIHRSKGKEWENVYILNKHLIPGKWVQEAYDQDIPGSEDLLKQEYNLLYVAITRSLETLTFFHIGKEDNLRSREEEAKQKEAAK